MKWTVIRIGTMLLSATQLYAGANAGIEQEVRSNEKVQLNGSGSSLDNNGEFSRFNWKQVSGAKVNIINQRSVISSFTAPDVDEVNVLRFQLTTKEKFKNRKNRKRILKTRDYVDIIIIPTENEQKINNNNNSNNNTISTNIINHNGFKYLPLVSPKTGKVWLDRNLGAREVCNDLRNVSCFGDLYQWGRNTDGHQLRNSPVTNGSINSIFVNNNNFFTSSEDGSYVYNGDWTSKDTSGSIRSSEWAKVDASSICPINYRVPTVEELKNELNGQSSETFLKLPYASFRNDFFGTLVNSSKAYLWTNTTVLPSDFSSSIIISPSGDIRINNLTPRSSGYSIRCIKDSK